MAQEVNFLRLGNTVPSWNKFWEGVGANMQEQEGKGSGFAQLSPGTLTKIGSAITSSGSTAPGSSVAVTSTPLATPTPATKGYGIGNSPALDALQASNNGTVTEPASADGSMPWLDNNGTGGMTGIDNGAGGGAPASKLGMYGEGAMPYDKSFKNVTDAIDEAVTEFKNAKTFDDQFAAKVKINALGQTQKNYAAMNQGIGTAAIGADTEASKSEQQNRQFQANNLLAQMGLAQKASYEKGLLAQGSRGLDIKEDQGDKNIPLMGVALQMSKEQDPLTGATVVNPKKFYANFNTIAENMGIDTLTTPRQEVAMTSQDYLKKAKLLPGNKGMSDDSILAEANKIYKFKEAKQGGM